MMKKVKVFIIVCLLCLFVPHESIAQTFGRTSSSYGAQMPAATMRSTSSMRGNAASYSGAGVSRTAYGTAGTMRTGGSYNTVGSSYSGTNVYRPTVNVRGFYTSASAVRGGVTAAQMQASSNSQRRRAGGITPPPPDPDDPDSWCDTCFDEDGDGLCDACGCDYKGEGGCTCEDEVGYCWCPIGDGWDVWVLMALLAIGYGFVQRRRVKSEECGDVEIVFRRNGRCYFSLLAHWRR